jgi:hypothetical protein
LAALFFRGNQGLFRQGFWGYLSGLKALLSNIYLLGIFIALIKITAKIARLFGTQGLHQTWYFFLWTKVFSCFLMLKKRH